MTHTWPIELRPETTEGRRALRDKLVQYAEVANSEGDISGLRTFFMSIPSEQCKEQVLHWLESYTPIRRRYVNNGILTFFVPEHLKGPIDLDNAKLNPWYSVTVPSPKPQKNAAAKQPRSDGQPLTDRAFRKKLIITAVDRFLADPSEKTRNKLIGAINSVPLEKARRGGTHLLQGGAPGLKR